MQYEEWKRIEGQILAFSKDKAGANKFQYAYAMLSAMLTDDQLKWLDNYTKSGL